VTVPPPERDRKLPERLRAELSGILAWIARGCLEWHREGLQAPDEVRQATREYRAEMDVLADFLADCCIQGERERSYAGELYSAYRRGSEAAGERPESQKRFGGRLKERGFLNDRDSKTGRSMWSGLRLKDEWIVQAEGSLNLSPGGFAGKTEPSEGSEPKNHITAQKNTGRVVMSEKGSEGSEGSAKPVSSYLEDGESAPVEQLQRIRELVRDGWAEEAAREQVLGKGWVEP